MALYQIEKDAQGTPTGNYTTVAGGCLWADAPLGAIQIFCTHNLPSGYHECDGSELSKTEYADLYAVIGDAFKGNKTPTTGYFCLPDLRECTLKGASDTNNDTYTIGTHQKIAVGEFLDDRLQEHQHSYLSSYSGDVSNVYGSINGSMVNTASMTGRTGATTEVKSVGAVFGIKISMVALPADLASGVEEVAKGLLKSVNVTSLAVDSGGNVHLGYNYTDKIPVSFVPNNPGSEIIKYQFGRYGNAIYITVNRTSGTVSGKFYYYEI